MVVCSDVCAETVRHFVSSAGICAIFQVSLVGVFPKVKIAVVCKTDKVPKVAKGVLRCIQMLVLRSCPAIGAYPHEQGNAVKG